MGKKRKDGSSNESGKRIKSSPPSPQPQPGPVVPIKYSDMPLNHKRKFHIHDDCGSMTKYIELIAWLRMMGCYHGSVFEDIPNLNWVAEERGYPLVEIEVITPQDNSAKFMLSKNTLYLIACYARGVCYQYSSCSFLLDVASVLKDFHGNYTTKPWESVGPKAMIDAVNRLATLEVKINGNVQQFVQACEVFFVHLSEAARLYPVESFVCRSLKPSPGRECNPRLYHDEEMILLDAGNGRRIRDNDDVYALVKSDGSILFDLNVPTPSFISRLIKKYSNLCKVWFVYALSEKTYFPMIAADVNQFHMRSIKSLRCTLAVLCNINLDKVVSYWKEKSETHELITPSVYKKMERKFHDLQAEKRIRSKDTLPT